MKKILIVYYTWSNGNTERIAKKLKTKLNADMIKIDTVIPYPIDYQTTVDQGQKEVESGYMPKIKPLDADLNDYDVIALGTPTWWYTMAPAVATFIHEQNWQDKILVPFTTNGGWPGHVIKDMIKEAKGATIKYPMEIRFDSNGGDILKTSINDIDTWINKVKKLIEKE